MSTSFRWGEHVFRHVYEFYSCLQRCKNYKNWTSFYRVMITNVLPPFLCNTMCIRCKLHYVNWPVVKDFKHFTYYFCSNWMMIAYSLKQNMIVVKVLCSCCQLRCVDKRTFGLFMESNQQCQNTEGNRKHWSQPGRVTNCPYFLLFIIGLHEGLDRWQA